MPVISQLTFFKLCCLAGKPWWGRRGTAAPLHHSALMCQGVCICVCVCASVCACVWCVRVTRDGTLLTGSWERATGLGERRASRWRDRENRTLHVGNTEGGDERCTGEEEEFGRDKGVGVCPFAPPGSLVAVLPWGISFVCDAAALPALSFYLFLSPSLLLSPPLPRAYALTTGGSLNRWKSSSESSGLLRAESNRSLRGWKKKRKKKQQQKKKTPVQLSKYQRWGGEARLVWRHVGRGFPSACGCLPAVVKTGMLLHNEDRGRKAMRAFWWCIWGMWELATEVLCVQVKGNAWLMLKVVFLHTECLFSMCKGNKRCWQAAFAQCIPKRKSLTGDQQVNWYFRLDWETAVPTTHSSFSPIWSYEGCACQWVARTRGVKG